MANWRELEALTDRIVGDAFGEAVRHFPKTSNGASDSSRAIQNITGILHTPSPAGTINLGSGMVTTLAASESALVIVRTKYPDVTFKVKDTIRGISRPGEPSWEIKSVGSRYSSIIVLVLNQV